MAATRAGEEALPVYHLRDLPMDPERGAQGDMTWVQFQGSVQLRLPLWGPPWDGVAARDLDVRATQDELLVRCRGRQGGAQALESVNGKLRREIRPQECWYDVERDFRDPFGSTRVLVLTLCKKQPLKPWNDGQIFHEELFKRKPFHWSTGSKEEEQQAAQAGWVQLPVGRPRDVEDPYCVSRGFLCTELEVGQSHESVFFNVVLDQRKLDEAVGRVPVYKVFGADCSEKSFKLFIRGDENAPILLGELGGKVLPEQTVMKLSNLTREVEGHRIKGTMERLPCLEVELVKAPQDMGEWDEVIYQDEAVLNQPQGSLEDFERLQLRQQREPSPDRGDWTPDDFADEQKEKADAAFKEGSYRDAVVYYTRALRYTPEEHRLLSNRAAAYLKVSKFQLALEDAEKAERIEPGFAKVYFRKGQALRGLKRWQDAIAAYQSGQDVDPKNPEWEREITRLRDYQAALAERKAKGK